MKIFGMDIRYMLTGYFFFQINAMYWFSKFFFNTFVGAYVDKRIN